MRVRPLTSLILVPDHLLTSYIKNSLFKICVLGTSFLHNSLQEVLHRSAKRLVRGCEKFVVALAYVFCLPLPGSCLARFAHLLAGLCTPIRLPLSPGQISWEENKPESGSLVTLRGFQACHKTLDLGHTLTVFQTTWRFLKSGTKVRTAGTIEPV